MLLAPVVRARKGEHLHVFSELKVTGLYPCPHQRHCHRPGYTCQPLEKNKKHTIEVVVDRIKVRDDLQLRLAESFETALGLSDGLAPPVSFMDGEQDDMVFSSRFACPECGYSLNELEPRLFSFNNPAGACPNLRWPRRETVL